MTSRSFKRDTRHRVVDKKYVRGNIAMLKTRKSSFKKPWHRGVQNNISEKSIPAAWGRRRSRPCWGPCPRQRRSAWTRSQGSDPPQCCIGRGMIRHFFQKEGCYYRPLKWAKESVADSDFAKPTLLTGYRYPDPVTGTGNENEKNGGKKIILLNL